MITCPECRELCDEQLVQNHVPELYEGHHRMIQWAQQQQEDVVEFFRINHVTECSTAGCQGFGIQAKECAADPPNQKIMCSRCHDSLGKRR